MPGLPGEVGVGGMRVSTGDCRLCQLLSLATSELMTHNQRSHR